MLSPVVWDRVSGTSHEHPPSPRVSGSSNRGITLSHEDEEMELDGALKDRRGERYGRVATERLGGMSDMVSMTDKLPNRDYYPLPHHQAQFDGFSRQNDTIIRQRESLGLNALDGEPGKPPLYSMPIIIECAILGSPHQKLTLAELRLTLKKRFPFYEKEEEKGVKSWEVSDLSFSGVLVINRLALAFLS